MAELTAKSLRIATTLRRISTGETIARRELEALERARMRLRNYHETNTPLGSEVAMAINAVTEPCPGEAHGNPYIDNCLLCAPMWGRRPNDRVRR